MIVVKNSIKNKLMIKSKENELYADYIATGRISPILEQYMIENIYPYYANPHSNAFFSKIITENIQKTREYIRRTMNLKQNQIIIFTGNGATAATNHLSRSLNLSEYKNINIIISLYEHHSNFLPWKELQKIYKNIKLYIIPLTEDGTIDYNWYYNKIKIFINDDLTITSITACSNVTGIHTDIKLIRTIINNTVKSKGWLFVDYACSAPYVNIDTSFLDAIFISMHKFIGGPGCPGILICNKELFKNSSPIVCGGNCIRKANSTDIIYEDDLQKREQAGTVNILGEIKTKLVLMIKDIYFPIIQSNETFLTNYIHDQFTRLSNKYLSLHILYLNKNINNRLPIISFYIDNCHHHKIVKILSDTFSIQARSGYSCAGLFGEYIKNKFNADGFCRLSFHWLMTIDEVMKIINSVEYVILNHASFKM
jgi:selenocysteine lyase/cysteine desulfurase